MSPEWCPPSRILVEIFMKVFKYNGQNAYSIRSYDTAYRVFNKYGVSKFAARVFIHDYLQCYHPLLS